MIITCVKIRVFEITLFSKTNNHNIALGFRDIIPKVDIKKSQENEDVLSVLVFDYLKDFVD